MARGAPHPPSSNSSFWSSRRRPLRGAAAAGVQRPGSRRRPHPRPRRSGSGRRQCPARPPLRRLVTFRILRSGLAPPMTPLSLPMSPYRISMFVALVLLKLQDASTQQNVWTSPQNF